MIRLSSGSGSGSGSVVVSFYFILLLIPYFKIFRLSSHASCYFPNGTDINAPFPEEVYLPCDSGDEFSMCCALNRNYPDKCRSDGMCFSTYDQNIWRDACTDRSWNSSTCVKLCDSGIGNEISPFQELSLQLNYQSVLILLGVMQGQYIEGQDLDLAGNTHTVTPCDNGSYCCGNGTHSEACCKEGKGLFVVDGKAVRLNPDVVTKTASTSLTKTKPSSTATPTLSDSLGRPAASAQVSPVGSLSSSTSSASSAAKSSNKTGAIVGGTVGGIAVLILLIGITFFLKRRGFGHRSHQPLGIASKGDKGHEIYEVSESHGNSEMSAGHPLHELGDARTRHEMQ